jgi:ABC-type bacteriocin/lantibiotic exporter with double-glycine peptidase domain
MMKAYPERLFVIVTHQLNLMNKGEEYVIMEDGKVKEIKVKR